MPGIAPDEAADVVAKSAVPLAAMMPGKRAAQLVGASGVPGLGDQAELREVRVGGDVAEDRRVRVR